MEIIEVSLKDYSSLRVGGKGKLCAVSTAAELREVYLYAKDQGLEVHILGEGTNTYFGEELSHFLFIKMNMKGVEFADYDDKVFLTASAGEVWDEVVMQSTERGLWGIENLSLIPGTVGAAPVQNIGAYGVELKDTFVSLFAFDTRMYEVVEMKKEDCEFGYRDSLFKREKGRYIITSVTLGLTHSFNPVLAYKPLDVLLGVEKLTPKDVRELVVATRIVKLPDWKEVANNGSFFKNPLITEEKGRVIKAKYPEVVLHEVDGGYKVPAAWLIEHVAGMKGVRVGDVGTWPTQPLVIINHGDATADAIDAFANTIREKVKEATGITLEQEVNRIG